MTMSPEASARLILNDGLLGRTKATEVRSDIRCQGYVKRLNISVIILLSFAT